MLGNTKGKLINQYIPDYVIFDLETTGISCRYDEIIEISSVKVRGGNVIEEFSELVNPGRPIPFAASSVNHISNDMVAGAPPFSEVLPRFLKFIEEDTLVGHNISTFDMKFLYRDCEKYFGQTLTNDYIDTLRLSTLCFPQMHHHRLSDMAEHFGIATEGAHRALADCIMTQQVFEKLAGELKHVTSKKAPATACPECGMPLIKRNGRYGEFWGCTGYPDCRYTRNVGRGR